MRKKWKSDARKVLNRHYGLFVALCLIAAVLGTECTSSLSGVKNNIQGKEDGQAGNVSGGFNDISQMSTQILEDAISEALTLGENPERAEGQKSAEETNRNKELEKDGAVLGRTRGVFARIVNGLSSGSFIASLIVGIKSITGSDETAVILFIILVLIAIFLFNYFVLNVFQVIMRRMYLEGRCYDKIPIQRAMFLLKVRKWKKAAIALLLQSVYYFLWCLTFVGGIVKHYSYIMVPYIIAENPDISARRAITLSRKLMKGHKWECFVLELSFLGWDFLGALTLGIVNIFYTNPYRIAVMGEYYAYIRNLGKKKQIPDSELLNDEYLFKKPEDSVLHFMYADVKKTEAHSVTILEKLTGIRKWMADVFGLVVWNSRDEKMYEKEAAEAIRLAYDRYALDGKCYPTRLYPIPEKSKREWIGGLHYIRHYSIWSMIMIFFTMSLLGWLWEVSLHLITHGCFVNRGILHGPWLPIYGSGSVLILLFLNKLRKRPVLEFFAIIILCGCIEYYGSWQLEQVYHGMKWWNYNGYFLNLHGRICAEGLLTFGLGGMLIVYFLAPLLDNLFRRIPQKLLVPVCLALMLVFCTDQVYSAKNPNTGSGISSCQRPAAVSTMIQRQLPG